MFNKIITRTAFTVLGANEAFPNIQGSASAYDASFLTTLRVLLRNREGSLYYSDSEYSADSWYLNRSGDSALSKISNQFGSIVYDPSPNTLRVNGVMGGSAADSWMAFLENNFTQAADGWVRIENVTVFFKKKMNVLCFTKPEINATVLFAKGLTVPQFHYLQCAIPAYLPWIFKESPVNEEELEFLKTLRETDETAYIKYVNKAAEEYNFREIYIKNALSGFEKSYERGEIERVSREIETAINNIQDLQSRINAYLKIKTDKEILLLGLQSSANNKPESELMDFFMRNKNLHLENVSGSSMKFVTTGTLMNFDSDAMQRMLRNRDSYIYYPGGVAPTKFTPDEIQKLMTAIFIDQTLSIKMCAAYCFDMSGHFDAIQAYPYSSEFGDYFPNPHIENFGCTGGYFTEVTNCLKDHDYIGALDQCLTSCVTLNVNEEPTMKYFLKDMYGINSNPRYDTRCIELPSGEIVTPREAVDYLTKKEEEANG